MEPHTGLNNLDYIVLGIVLLSAFFALFRGFLREVFSLISWASAYFAAVKFHGLLEPFVHRYIKNESLITPVASVGIFVLTLIVLSIIFAVIASFVRGKALTAIDRSLGFLFGIFRGALIVCLVYMAVVSVLFPDIDKTPTEQTAQADEDKNPNHPPDWLMYAKTRPALAYGSKALMVFVPKEELERSAKGAQKYFEQEYSKQKTAAQKVVDQQELDKLSTPVPAASKPASAPAYDEKNRDGITQIINLNQKGNP